MQKTVHDHKSVIPVHGHVYLILRTFETTDPTIDLRRVDYTTGIHTRVPVLLHYYC